MTANWRNELRWRNFDLNYDDPKAFLVSRWQSTDKVSGWFIAYRIALAAWSFAVLVSSFVHEHDKETAFKSRQFLEFWFIYPTNLSFLGLTVHFIISAAVLIERLLDLQDGITRVQLTMLMRISWLLYNTMTMTGFIITTAYWSAIYQPDVPEDVMSILKHGFNCVVLVIDLAIGARPYRLLHFYQPLVAATSYLGFTLVYWILGGKSHDGNDHINTFCDWSNFDIKWPGLFALFLVFPIQIFIWYLHVLRDLLHRRFIKSQASFQTTYDREPGNETELAFLK